MKNPTYPNIRVRVRLTTLGLGLAALFAGTSALAQQSVPITLSGAAEVPPVSTSASGTGQFWLAPDHTLSGKFTVSGLSPTAAHVHEGGAGKDGPVILRLTKEVDGSFMVPPGTKLTDAQFAAFSAGNLYVNVHSDAHPAGELRAQLSAGAAPSTSPRTGSSY